MQAKSDLVKQLFDFGLTINQAKVYLNIVQSGPTSAGKISKATHLHRQDIYKIFPKLEQMGLITKTLGKPVIIKAVPVETALKHLVTIETQKANDKIAHLKDDVKELTSEIMEQQATEKAQKERWFVPLTTDAELANSVHLTFEKTRTEYDLVTTAELLARMYQHLRENFRLLAKRGAKIRIIVENPNDENSVNKILEEIKPKVGSFTVKIVNKKKPIPYQIFDNEEVWISMKNSTESGLPCTLWTNGPNLVQFFKENFEKTWHSRAASIYRKRSHQSKNN
jgi:sugar-specific transcriptional regulator TrmB